MPVEEFAFPEDTDPTADDEAVIYDEPKSGTAPGPAPGSDIPQADTSTGSASVVADNNGVIVPNPTQNYSPLYGLPPGETGLFFDNPLGLPPNVPPPWLSSDYGWQTAAGKAVSQFTGGATTPAEAAAGAGLPPMQFLGGEPPGGYPPLPPGFEHLQFWIDSGDSLLASAAYNVVATTNMANEFGIMPSVMTKATQIGMGYTAEEMSGKDGMGYVQDPLGYWVLQDDPVPPDGGVTGGGGGQRYYMYGYGGGSNYPNYSPQALLVNWRIGL